jgi:hypothetical protein
MMGSFADRDIAFVGFCPVCGQGRQLVARESSTSRLFVYCEECEAEWDSPSDAKEIALATRDRYGPCTLVGIDDLREHQWLSSVLNR